MLPVSLTFHKESTMSDAQVREAIERLAQAKEALERACFALEAITDCEIRCQLEFEMDCVIKPTAPPEGWA